MCWDMVGVGLGLVNELRGYLIFILPTYLPTLLCREGGALKTVVDRRRNGQQRKCRGDGIGIEHSQTK